MPRRRAKTTKLNLTFPNHSLSRLAKLDILYCLGLDVGKKKGANDAKEAFLEIESYLSSYPAIREAESGIRGKADYKRELTSLKSKLIRCRDNLEACPDWLETCISNFEGNLAGCLREINTLLDNITDAENHYKNCQGRRPLTARTKVIKELQKIFNKYSLPFEEPVFNRRAEKRHAEREFVGTCLKDANIPCPGNDRLQRLLRETRTIPPRRYRKKRSKLG